MATALQMTASCSATKPRRHTRNICAIILWQPLVDFFSNNTYDRDPETSKTLIQLQSWIICGIKYIIPKTSILVMKTLVASTVLILLAVVIVSVSPQLVHAESQISPTDQGTLNVRLTYDEIIPQQETAIKVEFLNTVTKSVQVHIDYAIAITRDGKQVFGPTPRIHTSPGVITVPILFENEGTHSMDVTVDGILFQPIPAEVASFDIVVGDAASDAAVIPDWIKNNAGWWAADLIDDATFVGALQYLIQTQVLIVPQAETDDTSDSTSDVEIPSWIKNNAGWWAADLIDDATFVGALQYLIAQGILQVS